jgi:hypothetical protein
VFSINGGLHSFFADFKELRQGNPLSSYLFVIAIEVFSGLMGQMARHNDFRFHWCCEREEITNVCFADDLMIFCRVEVASVSFVRNCLDEFEVASSLSSNIDKSSMFLCGVEPNTKLQLHGALGYREGKLSVRLQLLNSIFSIQV